MAVLRFSQFTGMAPALNEYLLPDSASVENRNINPDGGGVLRGLASYRVLKETFDDFYKYFYRIPLNYVAGVPDASPPPVGLATDIRTGLWLAFSDPNAKGVRGPTVNDSFRRYYFTSIGPFGTSNLYHMPSAEYLAEATGAGGSFYNVGVQPPTTSPGLNGANGIDPEDEFVTRAYTVTFINEFGEESQPCVPVETTGAGNNANPWVVTFLPNPPRAWQRIGDAEIKKLRIYRTITGLSGATTFFKVADLDIHPDWETNNSLSFAWPNNNTYTDSKKDTEISSGVQLDASLNVRPPEGLTGLILMPNGIMAAFKENTVYFSEAYKPYSWPAEYALSVDSDIVGMGIMGQSLVVCTSGRPVVITGVRPDSMSMQVHTDSMPCMSPGSIQSTTEGVIWASERGLVMFGPAGLVMLTTNIDRKEWVKTFKPNKIRSFLYNGFYCFFDYTRGADGWMINPVTPTGIFRFDPMIIDPSQQPGFPFPYGGETNCGVDASSGRPWVSFAGNLYEFDPPDPTALSMGYQWRSKPFVMERPNNFSCYQLFFDTDRPPNSNLACGFQVWVTGGSGEGGEPEPERLVMTRTHTFADHGKTFRMPGGFQSDTWRVEFYGTLPLRVAMMATTVEELRLA